MTMSVEQMASELNVDPKTFASWIDQMKARVPALMEKGLSFEDAMKKANDDFRDLLIEIAVGTSPRARVAREWMMNWTWGKANEVQNVESFALLETLNSDRLTDLADDDIRRTLASMF